MSDFRSGRKRRRRAAAALGLILFALCALPVSGAEADVNQNLCGYNPSRGPVPDNYALDACVDGTAIVILNDGDFPVQLLAQRTPDGKTDTALTFVEKVNTDYAKQTRRLHKDALPGDMVLPGEEVRFEDGDYGASIRAYVNVHDYDNYVMAQILSNFMPIVGQEDAFKDLVAAIQESNDQYVICRTRPGLHACGLQKEARQLAAIVTFALDVAPGRGALAKLAKKIYNALPAGRMLRDPETVLNDYDTLLTQTSLPCLDGARLTIVPQWVSDTPSMSSAVVGSKYYAAFESILYSTLVPGGMSFGTEWAVTGVPGFHIGWGSTSGIGHNFGNLTEVEGPAAAVGVFTADLTATYHSQLTGQVCTVAHYSYPVVVTEPPPPPP